MPERSLFDRAATATANWTGSAAAFLGALASVGIWFVVWSLTGFTDTGQLVVNTGTTVVTFLMVFLIQNTQNRDIVALQLKLDELIRANEAASNRYIAIEKLARVELERMEASG